MRVERTVVMVPMTVIVVVMGGLGMIVVVTRFLGMVVVMIMVVVVPGHAYRHPARPAQ